MGSDSDIQRDRPTRGSRYLSLAAERVSPRLRWACRFLYFTHAYYALTGVAMTATVVLVLGVPMTAAPLVVGLGVIAIYAGDRVVDVDRDGLSNAGRVAFVRRHEPFLSLLAVLSYLLVVGIALLDGPIAFGLTLVPCMAWGLYVMEWLPSTVDRGRRLKDYVVLNTVLVSGTWATLVVSLPVVMADERVTPLFAVLFVYVFLEMFMNVELGNWGDYEDDLNNDVRTLVTVLGYGTTRRVLSALPVATILVFACAVATGYMQPHVAAALGVHPLLYLVIITLLGRVGRDWLLRHLSDFTRLVPFGILAALAL